MNMKLCKLLDKLNNTIISAIPDFLNKWQKCGVC